MSFRTSSHIASSQAQFGKTKSAHLSIFLLLILFSVIQLNFQTVLYFILGLSPGESDTNPILLLWAAALLVVMFAALFQVLRRSKVKRIEALSLFILVLCTVHGVVISIYSGLSAGMFAFLSWGLGIGLFLYVSRDQSYNWPELVLKILVFGGIVNALPVIWEGVTGIVMFKSVTLLGHERQYGISQSISILGLQLAVGIIASLYFIISGRKWQLLSLAAVIVQTWALLVSTSRGPLIYMILVIMIISVLLPSSASRRALMVSFFGTAIVAAILFFAIAPVQLNNTSQLFFVLSALSTSDLGNTERLAYYYSALESIFGNFAELVLGRGAGMLSIAAVRSGGEEFGIESSILKVLLELGLLGAVPFLAVAIGISFFGMRLWLRERRTDVLFLTGCFVVLLFQMSTHETLKAWIGSIYFWILAGSIMHVGLHRSGDANRHQGVSREI